MDDRFPDFMSSRLVAEPRANDNAAPESVSELAGRLKRMVEGEFGRVRLRGEISGYKRASSGHVYLALKDDAALIDGVMWRGSAGRLAFTPQDGVEVIATGKLTTYPGRSRYQIVIDHLELAGEGALMALLEKLKGKLAGEGLFDAGKKRPLPYLPRTIGIVTSPTGAVIRDILHRLEDRCPTHVLVWPVKVQGEGAAAEIAAAVRGFGALPEDGPVRRPDLLIVARGGGSIEDLWCFNEEVVVRAVAASPIPVISAVGHETDTTLCDHAADLRAPTPTAAAELAVPVRADLAHTIASLSLRTQRCVRRYHDRGREQLAALVRVMPRRDALLGPQRQRLDDVAGRLSLALERRVATARRNLDRHGHALRPAMLTQRLAQARARFDGTARMLEQVNPDNLLQKGYVRVVAKTNGKTVATAADARAAGALQLHFRDGVLDAKVERAGGRAYVEPTQPTLL
ncbi:MULTISPECIES: exodeoxyribonuclease VII large subunit [unclassified Sphingomonas]|uniref:exodeoxyribonuclease VII large subunit n=1 Tax=unclassified Sphingomonas TaxID=196159 RepID=UPI0007012314|nr:MULTISPECIES: exodeoxyribonuclease VII large subunit [unclassified Sphingomonas]KQM58863.1 exodeoxyribonuclease VII large subunit [Sphingomonas sp. Leaf16]KQN11118.1 exodeoxyribonuclease VII large subunit [Sphingomonas sp. Leaf29]KQN18417.1 exodeoxyribonuclease VII large subunit [Sphingomonas sp. Leaf32]